MTHRIQRLKAALFQNHREISLERALLYTASHQQTEGEPVILRRAKATAYILEHVEISIRDEELIAGNRTVKPRAGIMSPEMDPYWLLNELDRFPTRPQDRFDISEEDKRLYREVLFPYWEKRSMKDFINGQMTDEVKAAVSTQIFSINQTDKGQGHIIIDYPRLLNNGLGELAAQIRARCEQQPETTFIRPLCCYLRHRNATSCVMPCWRNSRRSAARTLVVVRNCSPLPPIRGITRSTNHRRSGKHVSCSGT